MKTFFMVFFVSLFFYVPGADAVECPEGYFCITNEEGAHIAEVLDHHNCMVDAAESGRINIDMEPNQIVITEDGQVFMQENIIANLQWCEWDLDITAPTEVLVQVQEADTRSWGFRLRVRLGLGLVVPNLLTSDRAVEPLIMAEPFFIQHFHALLLASMTHFGVGIGIDITRNLNAFGAVGLGYEDAGIAPIVGLSLSFN